MEETIRCRVCGTEYSGDHCPTCLSAIHTDEDPEYDCGGVMEPVSVWVKPDGKWDLILRCKSCGEMETFPVAKGDNPMKLMSVASKPLANPPFPIERLADIAKMTGATGSTGDFGGAYEQGE
ncbi:MAG: RNHCP domain-containing protein [Clostridia bacterium]|nr:RNHCP domain-containing protein [Clostridia bacterium]